MVFFQYSYLGNYKEHSHPPNEISKEVTKVRIKLRETSQIPDMNPSQVLTTGLRETPDEVKAQLGKLSSIQRDLLNLRKKRQHLPSFPYVGSEFEIPPDWAMTVGEDWRRFLIQDSSGSERFVGTHKNVDNGQLYTNMPETAM